MNGALANQRLKDYTKRASRVSLLTPEEETKLLELSKSTVDVVRREAFNQLIAANQRFVVKQVWKYSGFFKKIDPMDLVQEGNRGLYRAIEKYDLSTGYRLITYARFQIVAYIQRALRKEQSVVALKSDNRVIRAISHKYLFTEYARERNPEVKQRLHQEIIDHTGFSEEDIQKVLEKFLLTEESISSPTPGNGYQKIDFENDNHVALEDRSFQNSIDDQIDHAGLVDQGFLALNSKEKDIIKRRFIDQETLDSIGKSYKVSRERVRQIESAALEKMKRAINKTGREVCF